MYYQTLLSVILFLCPIFIAGKVSKVSAPKILALKCDRLLKRDNDFRNFRTVFSSFVKKSNASKDGLHDMHMSGSSQPTRYEIENLSAIIKTSMPIVMFDLRYERHGNVNGEPVRLKLPTTEVSTSRLMDEEKKYLNNLREEKLVQFSEIEKNVKGRSPLKRVVSIDYVMTEHEIAQSVGIRYIRLPVINATTPRNEIIDEYINLYDQFYNYSWFHFHCVAGKGRTTIFMCMTDMLQNSLNVSFKDIIERQYVLGGAHFSDKEYAPRLAFLKKFYLFTQERNRGLATTWSVWSARH